MPVHELPQSTLQDIPKVLRAIADEIEKGEYGKITMGVVTTEDERGNIRMYGLGGADYYRAYAMLHLGLANLVVKRGFKAML